MELTCKNLQIYYPQSNTSVIENLSFSMKNPGFNAAFGPSGVGKTTFARVISGLQAPSSGEIETRNIDRILYTYNLERIPGWSTIKMHIDRVTDSIREPLKQILIEKFEMKEVMHLRFSQLSMGQQNRINLIRYLLQDFDLLVMDESLANVDEKLRSEIILTVKELFPDKMFIYISHHLMEVSRFCNEILVFANPSDRQRYTMVKGLDYKKGNINKPETTIKQLLDTTMLEIMNAF
ncbi:MAG: ATP-binding cassette domain-containing protein [Desulfamplus sp.]|nr:ATP-binding cassette domain-containing protein [Desulfamplus sp.]